LVVEHSGTIDTSSMTGSVVFRMKSVCEPLRIFDEVEIPLEFLPACSDVALGAPLNGWTANIDEFISGPDNHPTDVQIEVEVANKQFTNWTQDPLKDPVEVEMRMGNGDWTKISNVPGYTDNAVVLCANNTFLTDPNFGWNPRTQPTVCNGSFPDGCMGYEGPIMLRAKSQCTNPEVAETEYSPIVVGYVDYVRPEKFGAVLPLDQSYDIGDEMKLRWSEPMETSDMTRSLSPDEVGIRAKQNVDYALNSGGVLMPAEGYVSVPQGPPFDAYMTGLEAGLPGWAASCRLWGGDQTNLGSHPTGVILTQGSTESGAIQFEFVDATTLRVSAISGGTVFSSDDLIMGTSPQWNTQWNNVLIEFRPGGTGGVFDVTASVNGFENYGTVQLVDDDGNELVIASRRTTLGNTWPATAAGSLTWPVQDFKMWSSQRETMLSDLPGMNLTGNELGLQIWLPFNELEGDPMDHARNRAVDMAAEWYDSDRGGSMDFADLHANSLAVPTLVGLNWTPIGTRNTTLEFWVKRGDSDTQESVMAINGTYDPANDINHVGWGVEIDGDGHLYVYNGEQENGIEGVGAPDDTPIQTDTPAEDQASFLKTPQALGMGWHHVAIVRTLDGTVLLHLDGENVASSAAHAHGKLIPAVISLGAKSDYSGGILPCTDLGIKGAVEAESILWDMTDNDGEALPLQDAYPGIALPVAVHRIVSDSTCMLDTIGFAMVNNEPRYVAGCGDWIHEFVDYSEAVSDASLAGPSYADEFDAMQSCPAPPQLPQCTNVAEYVDVAGGLQTVTVTADMVTAHPNLNLGIAERVPSIELSDYLDAADRTVTLTTELIESNPGLNEDIQLAQTLGFATAAAEWTTGETLTVRTIQSSPTCTAPDHFAYGQVNGVAQWIGGCGSLEYTDSSTGDVADLADSTVANGLWVPAMIEAGDDIQAYVIANQADVTIQDPNDPDATIEQPCTTLDHLTYGVVDGAGAWIAGCNSLVHLDPVTTLEVDLASTTFNNALAQYENCNPSPSTPPGFTSWFSGKLDELRVWNTAFPVEVIRQRMREGVYGYDNLVLHMPFEQQTRVTSTGETLTLVEKNQAYSYAAWDGTSQVGSGGMTSGNDDSSLDQPNTFSAIALVPRGQTGTVVEQDILNAIQTDDAPLIQRKAQQVPGSSDLIADIDWNAMQDECIIELNEAELYKYEDQIVQFTLPEKQVRDDNGNHIEGDEVFQMQINRNPLVWTENSAAIAAELGEELVYTTFIQNEGALPKYFEIDGAPSWMTVSPTSGSIAGGEQIAITLEVTEDIQIGEYSVDFYLKGGIPCGAGAYEGFCYGERFTLDVETSVAPPILEFDPSAFEENMSVVAKFYVNDMASYDDEDIVAAYVGTELRGYAKIEHNVAGQQLAFLTVFYHTSETTTSPATTVEFKVWDASKGVMRALVSTRWPTMDDVIATPVDPMGYGNLFQPLLLRATENIEVSTVLTPGWNWVSLNVKNDDAPISVEDMFQQIPDAMIEEVKNHDSGLALFTSDTWVNGSTISNVNTHYEVKVKDDPAQEGETWTIRNSGAPANPLETANQKMLKRGWNRLGYVPQQALPVDDALRHLSDMEWAQADEIYTVKSRYDGFAMYAGNGHWIGSLDHMYPGQGYRLYMHATLQDVGSDIGQFEWPLTGSFLEAGTRSDADGADGELSLEENAWYMNVQSMPHSMTSILRLEADAPQAQSLGDELGAFIRRDGQEICVGHARPIDTDHGLLYFLTLYGDAAPQGPIHFKWFSHTTQWSYPALETIEFDANAMLGKLGEPFILHFEKGVEADVIGDGGLVAYPNPFRDELTIHWHGTEQVVELRIED
ncbi:MAG: hypothetical protein ACPGGB_04175, partial [Flavobacteriales bacterium]